MRHVDDNYLKEEKFMTTTSQEYYLSVLHELRRACSSTLNPYVKLGILYRGLYSAKVYVGTYKYREALKIALFT